MTLSLVGVLADARILWRAEHELLLPIAGVFFFLPMLGLVPLFAQAGFADVEPDKLQAAVMDFSAANMLPILLAGAVVDFGTFAVLNLCLQGNGRTLGEVLALAVRRFLPFLAMEIIARALFSFGSSLFLVPGLFAFARTWLAGPAYAAVPEAGPFAAFRQGWRRSAGLNWLVLLAAAGLTLIGGLAALVVASILVGTPAVLVGGEAIVVVLTYIVSALVFALLLLAFALLRVAAYRRSEPKQGM